MSYSIEKLQRADISDFWLVFKEVLSTEFPGYTKEVVRAFIEKLYSEANFRYYFDSNLKFILIAKENKEKKHIIGFAVIDEPYGGVSLLRWLGVKKSFQKQGVGSSLIKSWFELARTQNAHKAELAAQPAAKNFYIKAGLDLEGLRKKSYFGIDQYIFGKIL